jgi:nucleotide-binding universal stress UspA family protein
MKVLIATDGSESSEGAANFLAGLNFSPEDEIQALHVISWSPVLSEWESLYENFAEIKDKVVPRILDAATGILDSTGAKVSGIFNEGVPGKAIIESSEAAKADLIVMGARGLRGVESFIVGSVTKAVAVRSHTPVLAVKPPQWVRSGGLKVLFATDGSEHSKAMARTLALFPLPEDTEITLLSVIYSSLYEIPERFSAEMDDRIKKIVAGESEKEFGEAEKAISETMGSLSGKFGTVEKIVKQGDPSEEILKTADEIGADIIAVGSSGMSGIKGMLGSVSRYVLNHSRCSVLIGKT